ncbi:hypothetical protein CGRA01v4_03159 [Colletotrichum graminicola]|nr:hypothetical protein CGRA01v4_03159 [Colletotrichum graminicola]
MNSYRALVCRVRDGTRYMGCLSLSPEYRTLTHTHTCARARAQYQTYFPAPKKRPPPPRPPPPPPLSLCKEHAVRSLSVLPDPGRQIRQRTLTRSKYAQAYPRYRATRGHSGSSELLPVPPPFPASKQDESFVRGFPPTTHLIYQHRHPSIYHEDTT